MLKQIYHSLKTKDDHLAFCIKEEKYTYKDLYRQVAGIAALLKKRNLTNKIIGIVATDHILTYASILACWFTRNAYLPLHPRNSDEKNQDILSLSGVNLILSPDGNRSFKNAEVIHLAESDSDEIDMAIPAPLLHSDLMYVLFTSGSTGRPKGVPISRKNLDSFVRAFFNQGYKLSAEDRFMQMFDLTFDVSVQSFVLPLCLGSPVFTVPENEIKYNYALKILKDHKITITKMVPSTLNLMKPFFKKISLPSMRYSLFSGEGLPEELAMEWQQCVPSAVIHNYYGPTEATIDCMMYPLLEKSYNGILSIGKVFGNSRSIIVDSELKVVKQGEKGELCIAGEQVFEGYLGQAELTKKSFVTINGTTYYRTGDLVFEDPEGDIMFCGRIDYQVQVQGYRVEPGEIEFAAGKLAPESTFVAVAVPNKRGNMEIHLAGTRGNWDEKALKSTLRQKLAFYMVPARIYMVDTLPLNASGKTDRHLLLKKLGIGNNE